MSEFNGSIRTAKNDDASVEYTVRGSDFKVVYYSASDQSSLNECEHGSTGDTHDHVRQLDQPNNETAPSNKRSIGSMALLVGGSVAVGFVGLIALPVAVGFWGVTGGFSKEETKEAVVAEHHSKTDYSPDSRMDESPDTKASSKDITPFKLEPDNETNFKPMKGNLSLEPLKLGSID